MIDPNEVITIGLGELSPEPFSLTDNIPHEVGTELKRGTIEDLATFISAFISSTDGVGFRAISVTDGQTLPTTTQQEFILVGKGTYYNVAGGSTIICTEELNAIVSNGSYWFIGVEIPVNVELAGITQFIRDGFISTTPSEDAVYDALALKANVADSEDVTNKISTISTYSTTLYPNEKATHDALDLKLNISDLPTNLTLYPTNVASDVSGYIKMVTDIHAPDYNTVAVDVSTPVITGVGQLVSQRITDAGVLIGQPGVFNVTTFGNIRRLSGSGTATFYFKVYHRDALGVETIIATSSISNAVVNGTYAEFTASGVWDDGDFLPTDRIVIKSYANRIAGGSDPVYQFQFGGTTPVRTLLPVPFSVVDAGYELKANKQNDLTIDGTGTKYPTVDAVNTIDLQKVLDVNSNFLFDGKSGGVIGAGDGVDKYTDIYYDDLNGGVSGLGVFVNSAYIQSSTNYGTGIALFQTLEGKATIQQNNTVGSAATNIAFTEPIENTLLNFPAKIVAGTYTLATNDEVVDLTTGQDIGGDKVFLDTPLFNSSIIRVMNSDGNGDGQIENNLDRYLFKNRFGYLQFLMQDFGFATYKSPTISGTFSNVGLTASRTFTLPDASGTIPIISQTITNGVTDKSPSEDAVFDALALKVSGSGTTNYLPKFTASGTIGNSQIFDNGTNVVIGATSSAYKLRVKGGNATTLQLDNGGENYTEFALANNGVDKAGNIYNLATNNYQIVNKTAGRLSLGISDGVNLQIVPSGNILIGTTNDDGIATNKLQVNGNITSNVATLSNQVVVKSQLDAIRPYKIYTALMTQSGTSAPVATVLENTLGGTVVWTRTSSGSYVGTLAGAFVTNKTVILYNASSSSFSSFVKLNTSNNTIDWQNGSDDRMLNNGTMIEIRVYN